MALNEVVSTTQHAPLERLLTRLRVRRVLRHVRGKTVVDFGCGEGLWASRAINGSAKKVYAHDILFAGRGRHVVDGIEVVSELGTLPQGSIDIVMALACFEHIEPAAFGGVIAALHKLTKPEGQIVGTVPTPRAKPVLEFLSYRLGLIDRSQIEDHKKYYDEHQLGIAVQDSGWRLAEYSTFQLGMNSFFRFVKADSRG